jgi:hypothetical protein
MKQCTKCHQEKPLSEFYRAKGTKDGLRGSCKSCMYQDRTKWRLANIERARELTRRWRAANPEKRKDGIKNWEKNNKDKIKAAAKRRYAANPEKAREQFKKWKENNPEKYKDRLRKLSIKHSNDPRWKLGNGLSRRIYDSLKKGEKANRHWESLVDFTAEQLKRHLEKRFRPGMTWDNYGTVWVIDHKIPIAVFNYEHPEDIDFRICWSLKNLQPLEAKKNRSKGAKIDKPFQPSLPIAL